MQRVGRRLHPIDTLLMRQVDRDVLPLRVALEHALERNTYN